MKKTIQSKKPKNQKANPLLFAAIAVGVIAIAIVFFIPERNQGNSSTNGIAGSNEIARSNEIAGSKEITGSNQTAPANANSSPNANSASNETSVSTATSSGNIASSDTAVPATLNKDGDVVIKIADISETATFYSYDSNGTAMGLFAVKASDGTIRTALDTCQVCNGSPYAFFKQQGDKFQCQNCGNIYSLDMIEQERGGCNPVPVMEDEKTVTDTEIIIPAKLLDDNAARFENWKKF